MDFFTALFAFAVILIPLIIIHEFGHFLAGKSIGVTILEFGLGFPPRAARLFTWGDTEFTLNWLPLGGFVMPYGEDFIKPQTEEELDTVRERLRERNIHVEDDVELQERIASFKSVFEATPLQKIWFLFGGPLANFVAAFVIFFFLALFALEDASADVTVYDVASDGNAQVQLQEGDVITAVDGESFTNSAEFVSLLEEDAETLELTVARDDETFDVTIDRQDTPSLLPRETITINAIEEDSPADLAGLQADDIITEVNGEVILTVDELQDVTRDNENTEMVVTVLRDNEPLDFAVTPERLNGEDNARMGIGLLLEFQGGISDFGFAVENQNIQFERLTVIESFEYSVDQYVAVMTLFVEFPGQLIRGELTAEESRLVSPVGVSQIGGQIIQEFPLERVILFIGFISIALAVSNLLPIPGLDGGRILFAIIELIRGKPMAPEREGVVHLIGLGLLLSLTVVLIINDLVNPIQLP